MKISFGNAVRKLNPGVCDSTTAAAPVEVRVRASDGAENEAELHSDIIAECRSLGWVYLHGSMAAETSRTLGEPDFVILADGGRVFFIECKSKAGKLRPAQLAMKLNAERLGHTVHIVRSLAQFKAVTSL